MHICYMHAGNAAAASSSAAAAGGDSAAAAAAAAGAALYSTVIISMKYGRTVHICITVRYAILSTTGWQHCVHSWAL